MDLVSSIKSAGKKVQRALSANDDPANADILSTLKTEHEEVAALLKQMVGAKNGAERKSLLKKIKANLVPHLRAEEKVVYDAVLALKDKDAQIDGEAMVRLGPGRFHLHEMLTKAIADGCETFDMTIGDEGYKRTWADIQLTLHDHVEAQTTRGWFVVQYYVALRKLKRFIKQTPAVWRAYTYVRSLKSKLTRAGQPGPQQGSTEAE